MLAQEQRRRLVVPASDDLFGELLELRASLQELEEARELPAVVVQPAGPPSEADYANTEVPLTSGAMLGLVGGCLLGAGRDRARRSRGRPTAPPILRQPSGTTSAIRTTNGEYHHAI
jgi:hypothetical protein